MTARPSGGDGGAASPSSAGRSAPASLARETRRLGPGPQTGHGPRDWRRTDERIREDVCRWMSEDARLDARAIDVRVQDGNVTLEGQVEHRRARRLAEDIAAAVPGVRDVFNRLTTRARRSA
ncbi:MAG TPA: BON domain-containing protein [Patescibacteria group bacterium]|nr:BON domain-containing protein [Patescibacteria group bacterium]